MNSMSLCVRLVQRLCLGVVRGCVNLSIADWFFADLHLTEVRKTTNVLFSMVTQQENLI